MGPDAGESRQTLGRLQYRRTRTAQLRHPVRLRSGARRTFAHRRRCPLYRNHAGRQRPRLEERRRHLSPGGPLILPRRQFQCTLRRCLRDARDRQPSRCRPQRHLGARQGWLRRPHRVGVRRTELRDRYRNGGAGALRRSQSQPLKERHVTEKGGDASLRSDGDQSITQSTIGLRAAEHIDLGRRRT